MEKLEGQFDNATYTENNAKMYATTGDNLLDFFAQAGATRHWSESEILNLWRRAFSCQPQEAIKLLFYFRDVRGGQGERRIFRIILHDLAKNNTPGVANLIPLIPEYGRWDDLYCTIDTPVEPITWSIVGRQLTEDLHNYTQNQPISLLAKWLKSERTHGKTNALGLRTRKALRLTSKEYRKTLSIFRKHIDVVERNMSLGNWKAIDLEKVPSQAMMKYRNCFKTKVPHFEDYMEKVNCGAAKINAKTLYPHQIVGQYLPGYCFGWGIKTNPVLEAQWKALPNYINPEDSALVIADVSGSMMGYGVNAPINVSVGLAMYISERMKGQFANKFLTFSNRPELVKIKGGSVAQKIEGIVSSNWEINTDMAAVFRLILDTALDNNLPQSEIPKRIIVVSDMQFDQGATSRHFKKEMEELYTSHGYQLPLVIWWNVDSHSTFPMTQNEHGLMVSGMSPEIMQSVLSSEIITPMELLQSVLNRDRYAALDEILKKS